MKRYQPKYISATDFAAAPLEATEIDLFSAGLGLEPEERAAELTEAIFPPATNLNSNDLQSKIDAYLMRFCAISFFWLCTTFYKMYFYMLTDKKKAAIFAATPPWIKKLNLSNNSLHKCTDTTLTTVFKKIPKSVSDLDLSFNDLFLKSEAELTRIFASIDVETLILCYNAFSNKSGKQLQNIFAAIRAKTLNLSLTITHDGHHNITRMPAAQLAMALGAIKSQTLIFGGNDLYIYSGKELAIIFGAIKSTTIDLSGNRFGNPKKLYLALGAIQAETLILQANHLCQLGKVGLKQVFTAIDPKVSTLDLRENGLSEQQLEIIATSAPKARIMVAPIKTASERDTFEKIGLFLYFSREILAKPTAFDYKPEGLFFQKTLGFFSQLNRDVKNDDNSIRKGLGQDILLKKLMPYLTPMDAARLAVVCKAPAATTSHKLTP